MSPLALQISDNENKTKKLVDSLCNIEVQIELLRGSSYNPNWSSRHTIEFLLGEPSQIDLAKSYTKMEWASPEYDPLPSSLVREVPDAPRMHTEHRKCWIFFNIFTSIEYAKTFPFFSALDARDKVMLTKYAAIPCSLLHVAYYSFARKFDAFLQPDGSVSPGIDEATYSYYMRAMPPVLKLQMVEVEYVLLKAICFCNPATPGLSNYAINLISMKRQIYARILFDYCQSHADNAPNRFTELLSAISSLESTSSVLKNMHILYTAPIVAKYPKEKRIAFMGSVFGS